MKAEAISQKKIVFQSGKGWTGKALLTRPSISWRNGWALNSLKLSLRVVWSIGMGGLRIQFSPLALASSSPHTALGGMTLAVGWYCCHACRPQPCIVH